MLILRTQLELCSKNWKFQFLSFWGIEGLKIGTSGFHLKTWCAKLQSSRGLNMPSEVWEGNAWSFGLQNALWLSPEHSPGCVLMITDRASWVWNLKWGKTMVPKSTTCSGFYWPISRQGQIETRFSNCPCRVKQMCIMTFPHLILRPFYTTPECLHAPTGCTVCVCGGV